MNNFFKENKIFLAIVIGALIVGGAIIISNREKSNGGEGELKPENCANIPELPDGALRLATKIIDGDTFLIEGGYSVRILGIDADERGHPCYEVAKNELEELILNKEVRLEKGKENLDQWCRYLRYVFLEDQNISLELVKEGLAVARFSPEDVKYREEIIEVEKKAKENKIGCKWGEREAEKEKKVELQWEKLTSELTGLKVIGACQAGNYYGKEVIVEGKIVGTYRSKTNTVFLNFEKAYPNQCFTGVIFSSDQYKFVEYPEKFYANKTVRVKGEIKEYQGKPEIILKNPSQIETGK
ncbi:MAG: thermonuclease family protein [Patescibacteria group bacterium]|nr:thermonuclease family protein [Patescibacteria group bacterium]